MAKENYKFEVERRKDSLKQLDRRTTPRCFQGLVGLAVSWCCTATSFGAGIDDVPVAEFSKTNTAERICPNGAADPTTCEVQWTYRFDRDITDGEFNIKINLFMDAQAGVTDEQLTTKKAAWKTAIEDAWSGAAELNKTGPGAGAVIPINVSVCYVDNAADADYTVRVHQDLARESMTRWSCTMPNGTAIHELGHMLGAFDEYAVSPTGTAKGGFRDPDDVDEDADPPTETATDSTSVMGSTSATAGVKAHHYACIQEAAEKIFPDCTFTTTLLPSASRDAAVEVVGEIPNEGDYDPSVFTFINCGAAIPTISEWGLIVLTLIGLTIGTITVRSIQDRLIARSAG